MSLAIYVIPGLGDPTGMRVARTVGLMSSFGPVKTLPSMSDIDQPIRKCINFAGIIDDLARMVHEDPAPDYGKVLVGYSIGGTLAFALAARLVADGYNVRDVILLDSSARYPTAAWRIFRGVKAGARHGLRHNIRSLPILCLLELELLGIVRGRIRKLRSTVDRVLYEEMKLLLLVRLWVRCVALFDMPRYDGSVLLLKAARGRPRIKDHCLGWSSFATALQIVEVPGDHWSMIGEADLYEVMRRRMIALNAGN